MASSIYPASPRKDLIGAIAWIAIGSAIVVLSWQMDRMEQQGATLHTMPGLWPGIVGLILAILGGVLAVRSLRRGALAGWHAAEIDETEYVAGRRFALGAVLFFVYALLLVGRGIPFWLATALFVTAFVLLFQLAERKARDQRVRGLVVALACGVITAAVVTFAFEQLFYVRLP